MEKWSFTFVINVKQLLNGQYTTIKLFKKNYWGFETLKPLIINISFESRKLLQSSQTLFGQTAKQPLNNFEPKKP